MNTTIYIKAFERICRYFLIGTALSFFGWCFEIAGRFTIYGVISNRGFLHLPLCPIYGITLTCCALLFGTPRQFSGILRHIHVRALIRYIIYFALSTLFSTALELITGLALLPFGVRLWIYETQRFNFLGIICPQYSLLWGLLITAFMATLWSPIERLFSKIPTQALTATSLILGTVILADFVICCISIIA